MRLLYMPDGQPEPTEWKIDLGKFRSLEIEKIERLTGLDYGSEYKTRLLKGNALARRALLFTLQRRTHPTLRFEDVDFADSELVLAFELPELREIRKAVAEATTTPEDERAVALAEIDRQLAELESGEPEGKALTPTGESATG